MGRIAKNMIALLGSQIATGIVGILMLIIVPQHLGDQQFGQFTFAFSFVGLFCLFASLGGGTFIVKQTAREPDRVGLYVFNGVLMSFTLAILLSGAAIGAALLMGYPTETCIVVAIACIWMAVNVVNGTLVAGLQGQQRMARTAIWGVVSRYLSGAAMVAALVAGRGLLGVTLATSLGGLPSLYGNGAQLLRDLRGGARLDLRLWKVLAVGGMPFLFWNLVLTVYGSIDMVMLSKMTDAAVVGWYGLAYRFVGIPIFLATIVVTASFPQLSADSVSASPAFNSLVNRAVRLVFFASAPMAAGVALVAGDLIAFLHYPAQFTHSIPLLQILALHVPVVGITMVLGSALMARDRQRQWVTVGVIAAVFNPLCNLFAIPATARAFGNGAVGASIITVATELLMLSGALYLLQPSGVLDRRTLTYVLRCLMACATMAGVVVVGGDLWLPARVVTGMLTYGAASLVLGTLSVDEVRRRSLQMFALVRPHSAPGIP
jgi:O-antigen/teichoic acid export membrane protein